MLNVVLVYPEIPNNTGNIGRLCVGTNARLHLIKPYGFKITDSNLKRAGLDYWVNLDWHEYENIEQWEAIIPDKKRVFLMTAHAEKAYYENQFQDNDWLVFGKESTGLNPEILDTFQNHLTIPMNPLIRSYNVANAVAFVVGEANRQLTSRVGF